MQGQTITTWEIYKKKRTGKNELETLSYRVPQLGSLLPKKIKSLLSLDNFKRVIKNFTSDKCSCRFCKSYIQNIGFVKTCPSN